MAITPVRTKSFGQLFTLALVTFSAVHLTAGGRMRAGADAKFFGGFVSRFSAGLIGLTRDEALVYTLFNPSGMPIRAQVDLEDEHGDVIAEGPVVIIPPGEFRSTRFDRADLPIAGDGTGRVQIRTRPLWGTLATPRTRLVPPPLVELELIDTSTGGTRLAAQPLFKVEGIEGSPAGAQEPAAKGPAGGLENFEGMQVLSFGLVGGQTARISVANDQEPQQGGERDEDMRVQVNLADAAGRMIAPSRELVIPAGEFRYADFSRRDILLPGDPVTGRLQMLAKVVLFVRDRSQTPVSGEIIDDITGRTIVLVPSWFPAPFAVARPPVAGGRD